MYVVVVDKHGIAVCMGITLGSGNVPPVPERTQPKVIILEKWLVQDNNDFSSIFTVETANIDNYCYTNNLTKLQCMKQEKILLEESK